MISRVQVGRGGGRHRGLEHWAGWVAMGPGRPPQGCLRPRREQRDIAGEVSAGSLGVLMCPKYPSSASPSQLPGPTAQVCPASWQDS